MYVYAIFGVLVGCEPSGQKELSVSVVDSFEKEEEANADSENNASNSIQVEDIESSQDLYDSTGLEEVSNQLDGSHCDDVSEEYANLPGATSYFTGIYTTSGSAGNQDAENQDIGSQDSWFGIEDTSHLFQQ